MFKLEITVSTIDEALEIVQKLAGIDSAEVSVSEPAKADKPKKETPKAKADKATKDGAKKGGKKIPTVEQLKDHLQELSDGNTDALKEYVRSFEVKKISDMSDEQRLEAWNGAEAYFGGDAEGEEEEDPMA